MRFILVNSGNNWVNYKFSYYETQETDKYGANMSECIKASPLTWPEGWKRNSVKKSSQFRTKKDVGYGHNKITISKSVNFVLNELQRMGIPDWNIIISTNLILRNDGLPRSSQRAPEDVGAAVWWKDDDIQRVIALDKYDRIADNIYAIGKTIEALRGIERWGGGEILDRTFTGFASLPNPDHVIARSWRDVLEYYDGNNLAHANERYLIARMYAHPDKGGTSELFHEVEKAWEQCQAELS